MTADRLLTAIADALNAAEQAGLPIDNLHAGVIWTEAGYVLPFGDECPGRRWVARERTGHPSREGQAM